MSQNLGVLPLKIRNSGTAGAHIVAGELPFGAQVIDVLVRGVIWDSATSATLVVGDGTDDDGYLAAADVKTANPAGTLGAFFSAAGGLTTLRKIEAKVTSVGAGSAGETQVFVIFALGN